MPDTILRPLACEAHDILRTAPEIKSHVRDVLEN